MRAEERAAASKCAGRAGKLRIKTGSAGSAGRGARTSKHGLAWKGPRGTSVGTRDGERSAGTVETLRGGVVSMIQTTVVVVAGVVVRVGGEGADGVGRLEGPAVGHSWSAVMGPKTRCVAMTWSNELL
jgi:hypothetical protein